MTDAPVRLAFRFGTLEIHGVADGDERLPLGVCEWDRRTRCMRAPAYVYAQIVRQLVREKVPFVDDARDYTELSGGLVNAREPRPFQTEALEAWKKNKGRGLVILPTGAGKTYVAMMAIADRRRSALVVTPTLDLVRQWHDRLKVSFGGEIGMLGGGSHDVQALTVSTYDSAHLQMEHIGNRFGLIVFDEVHHLPGDTYSLAAKLCIAPYRLGLTATPERQDGLEERLEDLIGDTVYRKDITDLSGEYLADYDTTRIEVELSEEEREEYAAARAHYRGFMVQSGVRIRGPNGWGQFVTMAYRSEQGRSAMASYYKQRRIAHAAPAKLDRVGDLLHQHANDRAIIFTQDNATAYEISKRYLVPVITHHTKVKERSDILAKLSDGTYAAVTTSKVLNEGVDVPSANVGIVVSGTGSVREHVQRLGRILRKKEGKRAILYELITAGTSEERTSNRRRDHDAYR